MEDAERARTRAVEERHVGLEPVALPEALRVEDFEHGRVQALGVLRVAAPLAPRGRGAEERAARCERDADSLRRESLEHHLSLCFCF